MFIKVIYEPTFLKGKIVFMILDKKRSPARYTTTYIAFAATFSLLLLLIIFLISLLHPADTSRNTDLDIYEKSKYPTVVIDAGHGGEDGGAIGASGVYEKELNLYIAQNLASMLRTNGINVVMTRERDELLYDKNSDYRGRKKQLDLAARVKIAQEEENCIFVSIHMNSFPQEKYRGLQVYYSSNNSASKELAESIQSSVCKYLQAENTRTVKKASSNIFLLDRITKPAVLIECGFISNTEECALISTEKYRQKLTLAIFCAITEHISKDTS